MRDGIISYRKIGKLVRFDLRDVDESLRRFEVASKEERGHQEAEQRKIGSRLLSGNLAEEQNAGTATQNVKNPTT